MKLKQEVGVDFKKLIDSLEKLVDDSGNMPKDWKKAKLPMISDTIRNEGSETPPNAVPLSPSLGGEKGALSSSQGAQQGALSSQQPPQQPVEPTTKSPDASQKPTDTTSTWSPELRSAYQTAFEVAVQAFKGNI